MHLSFYFEFSHRLVKGALRYLNNNYGTESHAQQTIQSTHSHQSVLVLLLLIYALFTLRPVIVTKPMDIPNSAPLTMHERWLISRKDTLSLDRISFQLYALHQLGH